MECIRACTKNVLGPENKFFGNQIYKFCDYIENRNICAALHCIASLVKGLQHSNLWQSLKWELRMLYSGNLPGLCNFFWGLSLGFTLKKVNKSRASEGLALELHENIYENGPK